MMMLVEVGEGEDLRRCYWVMVDELPYNMTRHRARPKVRSTRVMRTLQSTFHIARDFKSGVY